MTYKPTVHLLLKARDPRTGEQITLLCSKHRISVIDARNAVIDRTLTLATVLIAVAAILVWIL